MIRVADEVEVDDVLQVDVVLHCQAAQLGIGLHLDQDAVHRGNDQSLALNNAGDVGDVVGPAEGVNRQPEPAGNVLHGIARLDRVVAHVAADRGVDAGGAHLHDEATLGQNHVVNMRGPHGR